MTTDGQPAKNVTALRRAQFMSRALSDAARLARFSTRSKRALSSGGFQARRGAKAFRRLVWLSFVSVVVLPFIAGVAYYGFLASDQYVAEAQFTVMGGEVQSKDGFTAVTGIPTMAIIQDTQIVANYIQSRAAVETLDGMLGLKALYSDPAIDSIARFDRDDQIERFVRYWKQMSEVSIKMPSGIVEFKVRGFAPEATKKIAESVLVISERLINDLNERMNQDVLKTSEIELTRASERLAKARLALERARNDEGLLDAARAGESMNKLITEARGGLLSMQQEYAAQIKVVSESSPQMRALKSRIDAARNQIAELEATVTSSQGANRTIATSMTKFSSLDLERQLAERLYAGAAAAMEIARLTSERKAMYLNTFVWPALPERSLYPKRILYPSVVLLLGLALWGVICGLLVVARNHMA